VVRRRRAAARAAATEAAGPTDGGEGRETVPVEALDRTGPDPAYLDDLDEFEAGGADQGDPGGGAPGVDGSGPVGPGDGADGMAPPSNGAVGAGPVPDAPVLRPAAADPSGGPRPVPDAPVLDPTAGQRAATPPVDPSTAAQPAAGPPTAWPSVAGEPGDSTPPGAPVVDPATPTPPPTSDSPATSALTASASSVAEPAADATAATEPTPAAEPIEELDFAELRLDAGEGDGLVRADVWATAVFAVVAAAAAVFPDVFVAPFVVVSLALFAAGCVTFLWGFLTGIGRSREEVVSLGGLFFLGGDVAPARVRRAFQVLLALQVIASVAAAVARPFTPLAFGVLVPMLGIGLMALWGARYGTFPDRPDEP
jgi:hypothetical protein